MTVKECRKKSGLSITDVARKLGITWMEYIYYENNSHNMPVDVALLFSNIVNVPYNNIFFTNRSI